MKVLTAILLLCASAFASNYTYDVKAYGGAKCDGSTDDTAAIQNTIKAAAAAITHSSSGGPVYFPPSTGACLFSTLSFPASPQGTLVSIFDNGIMGNQITVGSRNAFIGNSGSFAGLGGLWLTGPTASWQQLGGATGSFVEIDNANPVYFRGINIESNNYTQSVATVNIVNSVSIEFDHSEVGGPYTGAPAVAMNKGFRFQAENSTFSQSGGGPYALTFDNAGMIIIDHAYVGSILLQNDAAPSGASDYEFSDILSENLNNQDFLTINAQAGQITDITLRGVKIADTVGNVYMLKNTSPLNYKTDVLLLETPIGNVGKGIVDPASTAAELKMNCFGADSCGLTSTNYAAFYQYVGNSYRNGFVPMTVYGSQYIPNPLQLLGPKNF